MPSERGLVWLSCLNWKSFDHDLDLNDVTASLCIATGYFNTSFTISREKRNDLLDSNLFIAKNFEFATHAKQDQPTYQGMDAEFVGDTGTVLHTAAIIYGSN